jgi:integrase
MVVIMVGLAKAWPAEKGEIMERPSTKRLISEYMQTAESMDLAESTREQKIRLFKEISTLFEYVDEFDIDTYRLYLLETGRKKVSVNGYVKMVRPIFKWAIRQGWIADDPFKYVRNFRVPQQRINVYKPCQIEAMLAVSNDMWRAREMADIWQARILAAATAGMRRSEVLNLTLDDVNFEDCEITIQPKHDTAETWEYWTKNNKHRKVPLVPMLYNLIVSKIIPSLPAGQQYLCLSEKRHWNLQRQRPLGYRQRTNPDENFTKPFKRIIERANCLLPKIDRISNRTFHDLRRTCITQWTQNKELSPQEVKKLAGHADIKTTIDYYAAVRDDVCQRAQPKVGVIGFEPTAFRSPTERSDQTELHPVSIKFSNRT